MVIGHSIYAVTLPGKANPVIVVADAYQGKGLDTILLEQLTEAAIASGISELKAHVAPENVPMLQVLRELMQKDCRLGLSLHKYLIGVLMERILGLRLRAA
jgi:ribosomal protein S18 acetylase RimI-like enzyme